MLKDVWLFSEMPVPIENILYIYNVYINFKSKNKIVRIMNMIFAYLKMPVCYVLS